MFYVFLFYTKNMFLCPFSFFNVLYYKKHVCTYAESLYLIMLHINLQSVAVMLL